jgi:hypothetical protein
MRHTIILRINCQIWLRPKTACYAFFISEPVDILVVRLKEHKPLLRSKCESFRTEKTVERPFGGDFNLRYAMVRLFAISRPKNQDIELSEHVDEAFARKPSEVVYGVVHLRWVKVWDCTKLVLRSSRSRKAKSF